MIVTIVGTGYVGLVTGACLASRGHEVRCVDISDERVCLIRSGHAPFSADSITSLVTRSVKSRVTVGASSSLSSVMAIAVRARGR